VGGGKRERKWKDKGRSRYEIEEYKENLFVNIFIRGVGSLLE